MYSDPADMARSRTREIFMLLTVLKSAWRNLLKYHYDTYFFIQYQYDTLFPKKRPPRT